MEVIAIIAGIACVVFFIEACLTDMAARQDAERAARRKQLADAAKAQRIAEAKRLAELRRRAATAHDETMARRKAEGKMVF